MAILTPAPFNFQQRIRSELTEGLQLSYADIMPAILHLRVTIIGDGVSLPAPKNDVFRVPGDYNFLATEMHGHVVLNSPTTEVVGTGGINALYGIKNRVTAKALNSKFTLVNADRNDLTFVEPSIQNSSANGAVQSPLVLATLMPICGGSPIKLVDQGYVAPWIIGSNERVQLTVSLNEIAPAQGSTEYGVAMIGALVRNRVG